MSERMGAFVVRTIVPEYKGCKDFSMRWFACMRSEPAIAFEEAIADYKPGGDLYTQGAVAELLSTEECYALVAFLEKQYPDGCSHVVETVQLPLSDEMFPVGAMPTGGPIENYPLCDEKNYDLPFKVWGYSDIRNHEPLPGHENDRNRHR